MSQAAKKPTKSERVARDVARAMAAHARRPSAGGEDVSDAPRWSDDDAAGRDDRTDFDGAFGEFKRPAKIAPDIKCILSPRVQPVQLHDRRSRS